MTAIELAYGFVLLFLSLLTEPRIVDFALLLSTAWFNMILAYIASIELYIAGCRGGIGFIGLDYSW